MKIYNKIIFFIIFLFLSLLNWYAWEIKYNNPTFGLLPSTVIINTNNSPSPSDLLRANNKTSSQFCYELWWNLINSEKSNLYDSWLSKYNNNKWSSSDSYYYFTSITCLIPELTIHTGGLVLTNPSDTFMSKEELFNLYQLEFTFILFISLLIILWKLLNRDYKLNIKKIWKL